MMFNPLLIAADGVQLAGIYIGTLAMVCGAAALSLRFGRGAPARLSWARRHKVGAAGVVLVLWIGTLYGGSKGGDTNQPPVIKVDGYRVPLYWDAARERYVPAMVPLRGWHP